MYNQLLISLQIEEKWYTFRLFFGILSCYYLQSTERHAGHLHMICGMPVDVPVPKNFSFIVAIVIFLDNVHFGR